MEQIRIYPEVYKRKQVCLRFELLGCSLKYGELILLLFNTVRNFVSVFLCCITRVRRFQPHLANQYAPGLLKALCQILSRKISPYCIKYFVTFVNLRFDVLLKFA